ncbi:MAG: pectate lyase [Verrucomicrobiota bacterium]
MRQPTGLSRRLNPVSLVIHFLAVSLPLVAAEPSREEAVESMRKAIGFYREHLAVEGGYASRWPLHGGHGESEHGASPTLISIQPPGTTSVGLAMLRAFEAVREESFLIGATNAAGALARSQLASGGWGSDFDFNPEKVRRYHLRSQFLEGDKETGKRRNFSTLDDDKTTSALRLLLELKSARGGELDPEIDATLHFGLEGLLASQARNGGWPQQFSGPYKGKAEKRKARIPEVWPRSWPDQDYRSFLTLNDGNLREVMRVLLRAEKVLGEPRFLDSAVRLGEFLLLAQLPAPHPAWAQQYNDAMEPVWARRFEPPAVSSVESLGAIEALLDLWRVTGEERFREPVEPALDWLESVQLPNLKWARFYELGTNRPLYCDAENYELTYEDTNLPTHYGFQVEQKFGLKLERIREELARTTEESLRRTRPPTQRESWAKRVRDRRGKVRIAIDEQAPQGYWVRDGFIDAGLFVKHVQVIAEYVEALDRSE